MNDFFWLSTCRQRVSTAGCFVLTDVYGYAAFPASGTFIQIELHLVWVIFKVLLVLGTARQSRLYCHQTFSFYWCETGFNLSQMLNVGF